MGLFSNCKCFLREIMKGAEKLNYFGIFFTFIVIPMTVVFMAAAAAYFEREEKKEC